jgi:hypothetical protein
MLSHLESAATSFTKGLLLFDCFVAFSTDPKSEYICRELRQPAMPQDADQWMALFAAVTEDFPLSVTACDMTIAGIPLIHANSSFRTLTGFRTTEIIGQNCRFLQAIGTTEPGSIKKMRRTLQGGERNYVRLTNLKKNGTPFANLLSFFPVYDDNMLYRFMVCVQIDENCDPHELKKQLWVLERFERFLPSRLPVPSNVAATERGLLIEKTIYMDRRGIQASSGHNAPLAYGSKVDATISAQVDLSRWQHDVEIDTASEHSDGPPKKHLTGPAGERGTTPTANKRKGKDKSKSGLPDITAPTGFGSDDEDNWAIPSAQLTSRSEPGKSTRSNERRRSNTPPPVRLVPGRSNSASASRDAVTSCPRWR